MPAVLSGGLCQRGGACILGVIDNEASARKIGLPENEKVAAISVYGYEEGEHHKAPTRKEVGEVQRFID